MEPKFFFFLILALHFFFVNFRLVEFLSLAAVGAWLVLIYVKLSLFYYDWLGVLVWLTWCLVQWFSVNSAVWLIYLWGYLLFLVILLPYLRNRWSLKRISCYFLRSVINQFFFFFVKYFITCLIFNVAGLPVIMLRFDCFCCWSLPASSLEHWWPPYYICMHGKHVLATFHPSSSRGTVFLSICFFFFFQWFFISPCFWFLHLFFFFW